MNTQSRLNNFLNWNIPNLFLDSNLLSVYHKDKEIGLTERASLLLNLIIYMKNVSNV